MVISLDPTGIEALDEILGGGIPRPSGNLMIGTSGSGKTVLAKQIAVNMLQQGCAVSYYCIDSNADTVKEDLTELGVDVEAYQEQELLFFLDLFSKAVERVGGSYQSFEPGTSVLQSGLQFSDLVDLGRKFTMKNIKKGIREIVLMDSITTLFLMSDAKEVFHYTQTLKYATRFANAIGIALHHIDILDTKIENALYGFADGIIKLDRSNESSFGTITGTISIVRMGKQKYLPGNFYYEVTGNRINISTVVGIV
jgi:KaiC/GvpD/RAD55 family RecA-like ATPase